MRSSRQLLLLSCLTAQADSVLVSGLQQHVPAHQQASSPLTLSTHGAPCSQSLSVVHLDALSVALRRLQSRCRVQALSRPQKSEQE